MNTSIYEKNDKKTMIQISNLNDSQNKKASCKTMLFDIKI